MSNQRWDPDAYASDVPFVSELGKPVVQSLRPLAGERILDLGCGDGTLAAEMALSGASVVGVDSSPEMVAAAIARGVEARVMDGCQLTFEGEFDAVFSNAALHWMKPPGEVVEGVARALRHGGRFVGEFGGHGNVAAILTALIAVHDTMRSQPWPDLWFFPTPAEYETLLSNRGFLVEAVELIPRPTPLNAGMESWLETFAGPFRAVLEEGQRDQYFGRVAELLRHSLCDSGGNWIADYVRLRFRARYAG